MEGRTVPQDLASPGRHEEMADVVHSNAQDSEYQVDGTQSYKALRLLNEDIEHRIW